MIKEITKYPIPMLCQLLFESCSKKMPRLNSTLMPAIEDLAKKLDAEVIYVHPLKEQASILEKYHGFMKTNYIWRIPCKGISNTDEEIKLFNLN